MPTDEKLSLIQYPRHCKRIQLRTRDEETAIGGGSRLIAIFDRGGGATVREVA